MTEGNITKLAYVLESDYKEPSLGFKGLRGSDVVVVEAFKKVCCLF